MHWYLDVWSLFESIRTRAVPINALVGVARIIISAHPGAYESLESKNSIMLRFADLEFKALHVIHSITQGKVLTSRIAVGQSEEFIVPVAQGFPAYLQPTQLFGLIGVLVGIRSGSPFLLFARARLGPAELVVQVRVLLPQARRIAERDRVVAAVGV